MKTEGWLSSDPASCTWSEGERREKDAPVQDYSSGK